MDAKWFWAEARRMCQSYVGCGGCPASSFDCLVSVESECSDPTETVRIVEEWSKEHPIQTRAEKFREVFGKSPISCTGKYMMPPMGELKCEECESNKGHGTVCDYAAWWSAPYELLKED